AQQGGGPTVVVLCEPSQKTSYRAAASPPKRLLFSRRLPSGVHHSPVKLAARGDLEKRRVHTRYFVEAGGSRRPQARSRPVLRGTEDYVAYPNGVILRRATY